MVHKSNSLAHYCNVVANRIRPYIWFLPNILTAWWWGVNVGSKSRFYGKTVFRTEPNSIISIGDNCQFNSTHRSNLIGVYSPCIISTIAKNSEIYIGNNCGFSGTVIGAALSIKLGNNVRCGANTLITDSDWHFDDRRTGENAPIVIEDNVWLGYGVKVLKGVHIGENSVIGAGSIVTHDIPANVVAAGNPCKVIRLINE